VRLGHSLRRGYGSRRRLGIRALGMYNQALATDYDGTLATDGRGDEAALAALDALRASGRKLILISGPEHQDLLRVFPSLHVFDRVVLENGAVLIRPGQNDAVALAPPPPQLLVDALRYAASRRCRRATSSSPLGSRTRRPS
jgi:hypothetical protein